MRYSTAVWLRDAMAWSMACHDARVVVGMDVGEIRIAERPCVRSIEAENPVSGFRRAWPGRC